VVRTFLIAAALSTFACADDTNLLPPGSCNDNDDCSADQHCEAGSCVAGTGNDCETNDDCGAGFICNVITNCGAARCSGNTCIAKPCSDHAECTPNVCRGGTCQEPEACDDTGMCLEGLYCNGADMCIPPGGPCASDAECGEMLTCVGGTCEVPTACTDSSMCPTDLRCVQGVCNEPCSADADCGTPPQFWFCDPNSQECRQRCLNDGQCQNGTVCDDATAPGPGGACIPPECTMDEQCDGAANELCEGGRCVVRVPCGANGECPMGFGCNTSNNRCEPLPPCRTDRDCMGVAYCDSGFCIPSQDCSASACPPDFDCIGDVCVPAVCRAPTDCPTQGELCLGGVCQPPPSPDLVVEVVILTPAGVVRPGTTYEFVALALDQAGRAVAGVTFEWLSSMTNVATIDADGVATGGNTAGITEIRARVQTVNGPVTSNPVELTNLGPIADAVTVTVVRATNGLPIASADVQISGSFGTEIATTDASGTVTFNVNPAGGWSVTAAHQSFDWISAIGLTGNDAVIPLPPLTRPDVVAGVQGTVDLSQVTTTGGLSLSLSGVSTASPLFTFDAAGFFGGDIFTVQVPMVGPVMIPAGNTVEVELMGFMLPLKTDYYARSQPGLRSIWSFGGRIEIGAGGGGFGNLDNLVAVILPFFQRFEHAVVPTVTTVGIPTVVDTNDFDGDGDTAEEIPDWNSFPSQQMQPSVPQSLRYQLSVDNLPFVSGGNANTLVVIAGTILPGVGFVPLGLDGQSDQMGSGIVQAFTTKMAPPHSGLEAGDYAVLASAVRIDGGLPGPGSVRLFVGAEIPPAIDLSDGWLDSPVDATWLDGTREVGLPVLPGADLYRVSFAGPEGAWHVYTPPPEGDVLAVPDVPGAATDRTLSSTVTVDAVDLMGTPDNLFDVGGGGSIAIDRDTRGFARAVIGR
jgi:hypothetical protein